MSVPTTAGGGGAAPTPYLELRAYRPGDEAGIVRVLAVCHPERWGDKTPAYWRWKHADRPGFRHDDVMVVVAKGTIVGCFHQAVLPMTLAPDLAIDMSFDGDFAVLPEYRGQDLAGGFYARTDPQLLARGVGARGGFTSAALNARLYGKRFGYVFVPTTTTEHRRLLTLAPLKPRLRGLSDAVHTSPWARRVLGRNSTVVNLRIEGLPYGHLRVDAEGVALHDGADPAAEIQLRLPYLVLAAAADGPAAFLSALVAGWVRGTVRLRGVASAMKVALALAVATIRKRAGGRPLRAAGAE